jgi:hypothetical protein
VSGRYVFVDVAVVPKDEVYALILTEGLAYTCECVLVGIHTNVVAIGAEYLEYGPCMSAAASGAIKDDIVRPEVEYFYDVM